jgi:hypothetical protein
MRRRLLIVLLAVLAAITMVVPLWAALTSEGGMLRATAHRTTVAVSGTQLPGPVAEAATLVLTGTFLLGLASAVRRNP